MPTDRNKQQAERIEDVLARMGLQITAIPATEEALSQLSLVHELGQNRVIYITPANTKEKETKAQKVSPPYKN